LPVWSVAFAEKEEKMSDALSVIHKRKSVRSFTGQSVSKAAIVVCAIPEKAHDKRMEFAVIDSTCASENILLAAEALGLGAVWTAAYPYKDRMDVARKALNIPQDIIPLNVIPVGHPTGTDKPKDKYKPENIHREKW
jgi:nitroreductase